MKVKNLAGTPYYTVDDIQRIEVREFLQKETSLKSLSQAGHALAEYLATITVDPETRSGLEDIMAIFGIVQNKALEIRTLSTQLKSVLNLEIGEDDR